ncbi:hypothetical protein ACFQJC_14470 [Haloferax namakaokahaiae]|uniref:Lipoprotein n=1 Tax=Haloferax namakaokahaiae TaxID=1748331 RepID=A0ABD5ZHH8_9EURY
MTPVEAAVVVTGASVSGCGVVVVHYARRLSNDARLALRLVAGEDDVESSDGLLGTVEEHEGRLETNESHIRDLAAEVFN